MHQFPSIVLVTQKSKYYWHLKNRKHDEVINIPLQPRIKSNDLAGVYYTVRDGLGIADLPYITVEEDIKQGQLIQSYRNGTQI